MFRFLGLSVLLSGCITWIDDPAPGFFMSVEASRRLVCEPTTLEIARQAHLGYLDDEDPRGDYADRNAVDCAEVVMGEGDRAPQDRAILDRLAPTATDIAKKVASDRAEASTLTWLVEAHYPHPAVSAKIVFAAKAALLERGLNVTDRLPPLATGDVAVLSSLPPLQAYAAACQRYFANGRLKAPDAVLGLAVLDRRETELHAGTCENGRWTWLQ